MNRREALRVVSTAGAFAVAGCLAGGSDDGGSTDTDSPTDTAGGADTRSETRTRTPTDVHTVAPGEGHDTDSPTDTSDASHVDTVDGTPPGDGDPSATPATPAAESFEVLRTDCGQQADAASVSFDDGVTVSGTIWGNNGCYTARLVESRSGADTLTVVVAAEPGGDTDRACVQCITQTDYEARLEYDGDGPDEVVVVHVHDDDRTTVETARR